MWRHVARDLAKNHTVIVPDLPGYGESDKPAEDTTDTYSKRTMARDIIGVAHHRVISQDWGSQLGFDASSLWSVWAPDLICWPIQAGHFMAKEAPGKVAAFIRRLLSR